MKSKSKRLNLIQDIRMNPKIISCFILSLAAYGNCSYSPDDNKGVLVLMNFLITKFYIKKSMTCYKLHSNKLSITDDTINLNLTAWDHENVQYICETFSRDYGLWKFSSKLGDDLVERLNKDINDKTTTKLLNNSQIFNTEHDNSIIENTDAYKKFYESFKTECEQKQSELPPFTNDSNEPYSDAQYKYQLSKETALVTTDYLFI